MIARLCAAFVEASQVVVFTGAGISTGSGIPDFRGPGGLWTRRQPVYYQDFVASEESRVEHWDYKLETFDAFRDAQPNAAHRALAELERLGRVQLLVTQNIDGLHAEAGSDPGCIVELHGTNRAVECIQCRRRSEVDVAMEEFRRTRQCPRCECGGPLKTATISFGQAMPEAELRRALEFAATADLALAIGSTLEVHPAASVPLVAKENGATYAIINRGPTAHDALADLRLEGDACEILPALVAGLPGDG